MTGKVLVQESGGEDTAEGWVGFRWGSRVSPSETIQNFDSLFS